MLIQRKKNIINFQTIRKENILDANKRRQSHLHT